MNALGSVLFVYRNPDLDLGVHLDRLLIVGDDDFLRTIE